MIPQVIKYVSIDGLTRYEAWNQPLKQPHDILTRQGVAPLKLQVSWDKLEDFPVSSRLYRREYRLYDAYIDEANGNRIFEYREYP